MRQTVEPFDYRIYVLDGPPSYTYKWKSIVQALATITPFLLSNPNTPTRTFRRSWKIPWRNTFDFPTTKNPLKNCLHGSKLHREIQPCTWKYCKVQMLLNRAAQFMTKIEPCIWKYDKVQILLNRTKQFMTTVKPCN